jgi:hypothetical protein
MIMDVRMCECIVCMKEKLIKLKRVASGHQAFKKKLNYSFQKIGQITGN